MPHRNAVGESCAVLLKLFKGAARLALQTIRVRRAAMHELYQTSVT